MAYKDRFKKVRSTLGMSQKILGDKLGLSTVQVSHIELGNREIKIDLLNKIADIGINPTWLITGKGEMFFKDEKTTEISHSIPVLDVAAAGGSGHVNETETQIAAFYVAEDFRKYWGPYAKAIRIAGDSMEPTIPRNGWVLVRETKDLLPEGIFIFLQDNELRCKRIQKKVNGDVILISDNSEHYDKEIYPMGELLTQITIIAEVIGVLRRP